ncbi:r- sec22-family [Chrysochromulina tobinii]|jgi:vesicle transport protein SEC22|uniref:R-sec22-family n=1 Tax=Chrysochromulina tobinii TaxID=1460289 RepID=A0A0M0JLU1_9EUKA|nr:r- sec22-family [Chrysochromulina tobinii]|eukprot:KOO27534.1 r- sec22-family [Chrysochromulina sp. CCMP291]
MPKMTLLARISDGLPLAASMEDEKDQKTELEGWKTQAKKIVRQLGVGSPAKLSIESGASFFHYVNAGGVCYLTLTDRAYPKRLAFNYLEELQQEFELRYSGQVEGASRPYAFIKFDPFIQKTKRLYVDTRTQRNLNKLNEDLADVQKIMTQNIQDVLGRGERLDTVVSKSSALRDASGKYAKDARHLNNMAMLRKYGPIALVLLLVLGCLWWRFFR